LLGLVVLTITAAPRYTPGSRLYTPVSSATVFSPFTTRITAARLKFGEHSRGRSPRRGDARAAGARGPSAGGGPALHHPLVHIRRTRREIFPCSSVMPMSHIS